MASDPPPAGGVPFAPGRPRPILLGMVHLWPLPGSPRFGGSFEAVLRAASEDLEALIRGGADGAILENFGDAPYFPGAVPPITVAGMTAAAAVLRAQAPEEFILGINVLRNDALSALSIAATVGASFIRVNVHTGAVLSDQGILSGAAHDTLRLRRDLSATVSILADVAVKHATPLSPRSIEDEAIESVSRGLADGILVTGARTGLPMDRDRLAAVRLAVPGVPVLAASGVDPETARSFMPHCDGFIVGTWIKRDGRVEGAVDVERVRRLAVSMRRAHG